MGLVGAVGQGSGRMGRQRAGDGVFFAAVGLLFVGGTAGTIAWCSSMSSMGGMGMPGGWTMSMAWMRMPGQSWLGAAAVFLGMWMTMMAAMMLPSLAPMLWRYRQAVDGTAMARLNLLTCLVGLGYFAAWALFGLAVFPLGLALAEAEMRLPALARIVPVSVGVVIAIAGALQFTAWKTHHLACCREAPGRDRLPADAATAWRHGVRLGLHCSYCCGNLTTVLLVMGIMDIGTMMIVTAAITLERLAPDGERVARVTGAATVIAGSLLTLRTVGLA